MTLQCPSGMNDNHLIKTKEPQENGFLFPYRVVMKQERRVNCWEFLKCGREPGGIHAAEKGVCPAAMDGGVNGINGGKNGGRCCWTICATPIDNPVAMVPKEGHESLRVPSTAPRRATHRRNYL